MMALQTSSGSFPFCGERKRPSRKMSQLVSFEEVVVYFTKEEWDFLDPCQRSLYKEVMLESYAIAASLEIPKPDLISWLEEGEDPFALNLVEQKKMAGFPNVTIKMEEEEKPCGLDDGKMETFSRTSSGLPGAVLKQEEKEGLYNQGSDDRTSISEIPSAKVTLDPDTAHPHLVLSQDCTSVNCGAKHQPLPNNPERFSIRPCVLGREGFTGGRHSWEVTEGKEGVWAMGVARKSVMRKGFLKLCTKEKIWAIQKFTLGGGRSICWASNHSDYSVITLSGNPRRIRVSLNCEEGEVSFHDGDTGSHLYTFSGASFSGETLLPFFHVSEGASLTILP